MSLTSEEIKELSELRDNEIRYKEMIQRYESEVLDSEMNIRSIKRIKKGKWIGFVICCAIFIIFFAIIYFYAEIQNQSMADSHSPVGALGFSVSTTVIGFTMLVLIFVVIFTIIVGARTMMELGTSKASVSLAERFGLPNYPSQLKMHQERLSIQVRELDRLKLKQKLDKERIEELTSRETPWYEQ
jgi:hypothetical protein